MQVQIPDILFGWCVPRHDGAQLLTEFLGRLVRDTLQLDDVRNPSQGELQPKQQLARMSLSEVNQYLDQTIILRELIVVGARQHDTPRTF